MSGTARIARHLVIHGVVQGVFFRESMRTEAIRLGVAGWVRNRREGTVEAWVEGAPDPVEALTLWAGYGPAQARVDRIDAAEGEPEGLAAFEKRPTV